MDYHIHVLIPDECPLSLSQLAHALAQADEHLRFVIAGDDTAHIFRDERQLATLELSPRDSTRHPETLTELDALVDGACDDSRSSRSALDDLLIREAAMILDVCPRASDPTPQSSPGLFHTSIALLAPLWEYLFTEYNVVVYDDGVLARTYQDFERSFARSRPPPTNNSTTPDPTTLS